MASLYERKLINDKSLTIQRSLPDILSGIVQIDDTQLELDNADGFFNALDLRGTVLSVDRFERTDNFQRTGIVGPVISQKITSNSILLTVAGQDMSILRTMLPKRVITASTFPLAHAEQGLNRAIPIAFGQDVVIEMAFVGDNTASNFYDYLICEGTPTITNILRDTVGNTLAIVPAAEYSVNDAAYPGYRVIRFTQRQVNFGGGLHRLFATINSSLSTERNFAEAIRSVLSNSTWGLGASVVSADFSAVAANLDTIGGLYCDGVITHQRQALDILNELLVRGMRIRQTSTGAWTIAIDTLPGTLRASFGHGKNQSWGNVIDFQGISKTSIANAYSSLVLEYRPDTFKSIYILTASRSVLSVGRELRVQNSFVRDRTTADKLVDFAAKRLVTSDEYIEYSAGQEAAELIEGDLVRYECPDRNISDYYQVRSIQTGLDVVDIDAWLWSAADYTYTAGTLPPEPSAVTDTDYSKQTPTAPTSLSLVASGVESDGQAGFFAWVRLQYTIAAETWAETIVRRRRNGETNWETVAVDQLTGAGLQTKITGLVPGTSYDYQVSRVNVVTRSLSASASLTAQVAPTDLRTPTTPSSFSIAASGTESDGQNAFFATVTLQYTIAAETWAQTIVKCRRNGATNWEVVAVDQATGAGLQTKITGLITGLSYDYQVTRVNGYNPALSASATLTAQVAPGDTTAPATPGTPTVSDKHLKTATFVWTAPADDDMAGYYYDIRTASAGGGSLITSGTVLGGRTVTLTLNQIAYSTTRYFRVAGIDYSGNGGSSGNFSTAVSFSFTAAVTVDVGDDQITTPKVPDNAITVDGFYSNDASYTLTNTVTSIGSVTVSTDGGSVVVIGKCLVSIDATSTVEVLLYKGSTAGTLIDQGILISGADALQEGLTLVAQDSSPAASQTYTLAARWTSGGGSVAYRRVFTLNRKK